MCNTVRIESKVKDYEVNFVEDFISTLKCYTGTDSFLVVDKHIIDSYGRQICSLFSDKRVFIIEATEQNKTIEYCHDLLKVLIRNNIRKNNIVVAIGGGIVQDISAFVSSILYRGIEWVFYPTTLLAQADSCIGGKSSINLDEYKNLLGTFYPPSRIFIDMSFLETLPVEAIKSGIGEILHFYLIVGNKMAADLTNDYEKIILSPKLLKKYISLSLEIKKEFIEIDEFDKNERNLLNYGHTFGHAIETVSGYVVNHGQAVTMGMDIANYISMRLGYLDKSTFDFMHSVLEKNIPDFRIDEKTLESYLKALLKDKKNIDDKLVCILTDGPGSMRKVHIDITDEIKGMILEYFKG